jgi:imidazolonepropionase-like amidohydrolase
MRFTASHPSYLVVCVAVPVLAACAFRAARPSSPRPRAQVIALVGGTVIDGSGDPPVPDTVVLIEGDRIERVGPRATVTIPDGAERHDVAGLTVLPGLVDSHVHLRFMFPMEPGEPSAGALDAALERLLRAGVTSIRDVGGPFPWIVEVSRSIDAGRRSGPRIFAAGPLITAPGGHPAGTLLKGQREAIGLATREVASADAGREAVRQLAAGGVSLIKVVFDSGREGSARFPIVPRLDVDTLDAVVSEAKQLHLPVTVHWGNASELPFVVAAGPTQIEHAGYGDPIPDALIGEIVRMGIAVDPTLTVFSALLSPLRFQEGPLANIRKLARAGAILTAGTDTPLGATSPGESLHRELELLVEAGLTPMQAIQAATVRPARVLGRTDLGTVQAGMLADLVVVAGDPLASISATRNVRIVLRDGRIVHDSARAVGGAP